MDFDGLSFKAHDPHLGYPGSSVQGQLHLPGVIRRDLGDLDQQQHVLGGGASLGVEIRAGLKLDYNLDGEGHG